MTVAELVVNWVSGMKEADSTSRGSTILGYTVHNFPDLQFFRHGVIGLAMLTCTHFKDSFQDVSLSVASILNHTALCRRLWSPEKKDTFAQDT